MAEQSPAAQAAAELVAGAARLVEAPEQGEQPAPVAEETPEIPSFTADLSGIEDILDEPEDLADLEEEEPPAETGEFDEYDPDRAQAEIKRLNKKLKWESEQRVKNGQKVWRAEAKRRFPLAAPLVDRIEATSRRAFLREAAEYQQLLDTGLKPILSRLDAQSAQVEADARATAEANTASAWGRPTSGPAQPLVEEARTNQDQDLDRRRYGSPLEMVQARFRSDPRFKDGI